VRSRWALLEQADMPPVILEINTDVSDQKQYEESLRQLSGHLMRVQDEERRRIARDLHDSTGQKLAAARMFLDAVKKTSGSKPNDKRISETADLIDQAFQDIRTLSQILHPPLLDEAGLVSATRSMVDSFAGRAKIAVDFQVPEDFGRLPQAVELALFRVIQESLTNIHRHSGATQARIELVKNGDEVALEVRDNGKGLPPDLVHATDGKQTLGVGILGMKERLSQLGGTLKIDSGKQGTVVKAVVRSDGT
jgi:signal transduction histidine kinase